MLFLPHQRKKRGKKVIFIGLYKCNLQIVKILPRKYSAEVFLLKQNALQKERFAMLCGLLKYITIFRKKKVLRKKKLHVFARVFVYVFVYVLVRVLVTGFRKRYVENAAESEKELKKFFGAKRAARL